MHNIGKINFEDYDIEFSEDEFDNMSKEDLEECDELLKKIESILQ